MLSVNTKNLSNSWKKCTKGSTLCTIAKTSLILQYISFLLSLVIGLYGLYMSMETMDKNKKLSSNYAMGSFLLVIVSYLLLKVVQMSPDIAVIILGLNILMFLIREKILLNVSKKLGLPKLLR